MDTKRSVLHTVIDAWSDPDYAVRERAVEAVLRSGSRYTDEMLTFAINASMQGLVSEGRGVSSWKRPTGRRLGLLDRRRLPLAALTDCVAAWRVGHSVSVYSQAPHATLLQAWVTDLVEHGFDRAAWVPEAPTLGEVDALLVSPPRDPDDAPPEMRQAGAIYRRASFSAAFLNGQESDDDREALAQDVLLYDGMTSACAAVVWAPRGTDPDPYFEAMATFRGVVPSHPDTPGTLRMQQAFLAATDQPHAYGDELAFLVSKGEPEPQSPGHVRWAEYEDPAEVTRWMKAHAAKLVQVVGPVPTEHQVRAVPCRALGEAHRPRPEPDAALQEAMRRLAEAGE